MTYACTYDISHIRTSQKLITSQNTQACNVLRRTVKRTLYDSNLD